MPNEIERVHYFDYQFLTAQDFTAEQNYHKKMREFQNKYTYAPGVLDGLTVQKHASKNALIIQPGMALDAEGQAIIVSAAIEYEPSGRPDAIYLQLSTRDILDDQARVIRKAEGPKILPGPPEPAGAIQLAKITWNQQGNIIDCDDSVRPQAGPRGLRQIEGPLRIGPPGRPRAEISGVRLYVDGDLGIEGSLALTGEVYGATGNVFDNYASRSRSDVAENYVSEMALQPGDVVSLHPEKDQIVPSQVANDPLVIGVVSTAPGLTLGAPRGHVFPVALCGRVPCKVVTENGPIRRGDLLTSSSTPGSAMKAQPLLLGDQAVFRPGTIIGKALAAWSDGQGRIEMFVLLR